MENKGNFNPQEIQIQGLLDRYLRSRSAKNHSAELENHLDEDALTAFVEGNLGQRETRPILNHLVDCSFCLHVTAELVKLDFAFASEEITVPVAEAAPSKISEVLSGLLSRIFGTNDGAVFAHHETEEEKEENKEDKKE